ncbi:Na/Pi cotransporter family protein [Azospirillum agricola]|uniref:Na/Pi cotransporter family protein n=1 Tax=Azospirillum agricola TaxID=1720247 RepID=UPI000A0EF910|nr:Na/Pi symporter [Azospirillum agricola]SMH60150.1 phosphate:Na+ symporter [Azospirillum lipoferum]
MDADILQDMVFRVLGGLGLFMLGMEFLSDGIQSLAVARMRQILERFTTNRIFALLTGTFVTGVIQSSTVMTVMVVGFVNSGIVTLEQAIGLIMGANIGTTLTTVFVALPIGKWGLPVIGVAALVYLFVGRPRVRYAALALLGLGMIFYGLDLLTSGFRPIRSAPAMMEIFTWLSADSYGGILLCVLLSALVTAIIHSSSATVGIVMGLGASGVMDWHAALAFTLGADVGTTATSYVAALNLSPNARRTAYGHMAFNVIGVLLMLPLFPLSLKLVAWALGGDPGAAVTAADATVSHPLVPIAIASYSTGFNVFNTAVMLPFVPLMARILSKVGQGQGEDDELSVPRHLFAKALEEPETAVRLLEREQVRFQQALPALLSAARFEGSRPDESRKAGVRAAALHTALGSLAREIDDFAGNLCKRPIPPPLVPVLMRVLQSQDHGRALERHLFDFTRELGGEPLSPAGRSFADILVEALDAVLLESLAALGSGDTDDLRMMRSMIGDRGGAAARLRQGYLEADGGIPLTERTRLLAALGLAESALWELARLLNLRLGEESGAQAGASGDGGAVSDEVFPPQARPVELDALPAG